MSSPKLHSAPFLKVGSHCWTSWDGSALWSEAVLGGINLWDWKVSKSTPKAIMRHVFFAQLDPTNDQRLCVTFTHGDVQTHRRKGKKGNRGLLRVCFSSAANTYSFSSTRHFFFLPVNGPSSITMSRTTPEIWRYSSLLVDYFNRIPPPLTLSGISQRLIRRQAGWESVLLGKVWSLGDTTPFWSATQKPPSAAESGRYHCTLQRHNHKYIHLVKNTRGFAVGQIMTLPILWKCMTEGG